MTKSRYVSGDIAKDIEHSNVSGDSLSFPLRQYIKEYRDRLDGMWFSRSDSPVIYVLEVRKDCTEHLWDTTVGVWKEQWWHCAARSDTDALRHIAQTEIPYVCCSEKAGYEWALWKILR